MYILDQPHRLQPSMQSFVLGEAGAAAPPADAAAGAAAEPELLYALPLFRKPAFPGLLGRSQRRGVLVM